MSKSRKPNNSNRGMFYTWTGHFIPNELANYSTGMAKQWMLEILRRRSKVLFLPAGFNSLADLALIFCFILVSFFISIYSCWELLIGWVIANRKQSSSHFNISKNQLTVYYRSLIKLYIIVFWLFYHPFIVICCSCSSIGRLF